MKLFYVISSLLLIISSLTLTPISLQADEGLLARGFRGRPIPMEGEERIRPPIDRPENLDRVVPGQKPLDPEERIMRRDELLEEPFVDPYFDPESIPPPEEEGVNMDDAGMPENQKSDFDSDDDQDFDKP